MQQHDQTAIRAASAQINLINWIIECPGAPVPAEIVRDSMETYADFLLERLIAGIQSGLSYENDPPPDDFDGLNEPDTHSKPD